MIKSQHTGDFLFVLKAKKRLAKNELFGLIFGLTALLLLAGHESGWANAVECSGKSPHRTGGQRLPEHSVQGGFTGIINNFNSNQLFIFVKFRERSLIALRS